MKLWQKLASKKNLWALFLCLLVILLLICTTAQTPRWIYQGF